MRNHMQALEHFFDVVLPKAGMVESSRTLLKEKTASHDAIRAHSGTDGDRTWLARLDQSGIRTFELLEVPCCYSAGD